MICAYGSVRMLRKNGYKLILRFPYLDQTWGNEFYDLTADPRETVKLFQDPTPEQSLTIQSMTTQLEDYFAVYTVAEHEGLHMEAQPPTSLLSS